jgi:glycosyl hydrolase family 35
MKYQVEFKNHHFHLKGDDGSEKDIIPVSGEFHYWRNIVEYWDTILDNIQNKLELNYIQSYIAWEYHETSPNEYDFVGKTTPNKNLDKFLSMCEDRNIFVGIRPGPWIYSEMAGGGIPQRWSKKDMMRLDADFAVEAEQWVKGISEALKPHLVTNGGCIICLQVDNEVSGLKSENLVISGDCDTFGTLGYWLKNIRWNDDIKSANLAYDTDWEDWGEVEPMITPRTTKEVYHFQDCHKFYEWCQTAWINRVANWYKEAGIDVPLYLNTTGQPFPQDPELIGMKSRHATKRNTGDGIDLIGSDHYPLPLEIDPDHASVKEIGKSGGFAYYDLLGIIFNGKYGAAVSPMAWIAEFRSGGYMPTLWASAADRWNNTNYYRYYALIGLLGGFHGWNWYMLVDRDRFHCSPMSTDGRLWDHIGKEFRSLVHGMHSADWPRFEPANPIGLYWDRTQMYTYSKTMPMSAEFSIAERNPFNESLKALFFGSVSWELIESRHDFTPKSNPAIIYGGWDDLGLGQTQKLRNYVEEGGLLIIQSTIPSRSITENGVLKNEIFKDLPRSTGNCHVKGNYAINIPKLSQKMPISKDECDSFLTITGGKTSTFLLYELDTDSVPILAHGMNIGYIKTIGKGHVIVLGFDLHEKVIGEVLKWWGISQEFELPNQSIVGAAYKDEKTLAIPFINYGQETLTTTFKFPSLITDQNYLVTHHFDGATQTKTGRELQKYSFSVKPKHGDLITITPKEENI